MPTDRELLRQALDALECAKEAIEEWGSYASDYFKQKYNLDGDVDDCDAAIEALRARLAQPEPEKSLSQRMREAGFTPRDTKLECDGCGKKFSRLMLPIHDCDAAQPEPPCKTGSQCVGGKCERCVVEPEPVAKMREILEVQGQDGTWNYDPYFHGMYNGMEFMLAMVEDREPVFRSSPGKWLGYTAPPRKEWKCKNCGEEND